VRIDIALDFRGMVFTREGARKGSMNDGGVVL
jgi:hypothetical protein